VSDVKSTILQLVVLVTALLASGAAVGGEKQIVALRGHDGHGRHFDLSSMRGQVVAVTFASRFTRSEADRVNNALMSHAAEGDMMVINVVDFGGIPSLFHGYARRKAAEHDQPGKIYHLADESGEIRRQFQVEPGKRVDILVIDRDGSLRGRFSGSGQVDEAARLVDQLRTSTAQRD
jgi:hypothetical protein